MAESWYRIFSNKSTKKNNIIPAENITASNGHPTTNSSANSSSNTSTSSITSQERSAEDKGIMTTPEKSRELLTRGLQKKAVESLFGDRIYSKKRWAKCKKCGKEMIGTPWKWADYCYDCTQEMEGK